MIEAYILANLILSFMYVFTQTGEKDTFLKAGFKTLVFMLAGIIMIAAHVLLKDKLPPLKKP